MEQLDNQDVDTGEKGTRVLTRGADYVDPEYLKGLVTDNTSGPQVLNYNDTPPDLVANDVPIFKKRGDLTSRELNNIFKTRQDKIDFQQDIAKAKVLGNIQDERELNRLKAQGWKGNDEILFDTDKKQYFQQFTNPFTSETKRYYYPENAVPKSIIEKKLTASGLTGKYKMLAQAEEDIASYEKDGNTSGISEGRYLAAKRVIDADNSGQDVREALANYYSTRNVGQLRIQPSQQAGLDLQESSQDRAEQNRIEDLNLKLSDAESKIVEFDSEYTSKGNTVRAAADNLNKAKTDLENGDIDQKQYNIVEKQFNDAVEDMNRAKAKRDAAITNRDNVRKLIENRPAKKSISCSNNTDANVDYTKMLADPNIQALLVQAKANPKNQNKSDIQILQAIIAAKREKKK